MFRKIFNRYRLRNQNTVQKTGFFIGITSCLIAIFLHNPFDGYYIFLYPSILDSPYVVIDKITGSKHIYTGHQTSECLYAADLFYDAKTQKDRDVATQSLISSECHEGRLQPISDWSSVSPEIPWLGNFLNFVKLITAIVLVSGVWIAIFRTMDKEDRP